MPGVGGRGSRGGEGSRRSRIADLVAGDVVVFRTVVDRPVVSGVLVNTTLRTVGDRDQELSQLIIQFRRFVGGLKEWCTKRGISYIFTPNHNPFDKLILNYLRERGLVK